MSGAVLERKLKEEKEHHYSLLVVDDKSKNYQSISYDGENRRRKIVVGEKKKNYHTSVIRIAVFALLTFGCILLLVYLLGKLFPYVFTAHLVPKTEPILRDGIPINENEKEFIEKAISASKDYFRKDVFLNTKRWRFAMDENVSGNPGIDCDFDDSDWEVVDLPHDFIVSQPFSDNGDKSHGYKDLSKGWYRLKFTLSSELQYKKLWFEFEGVQRNSDYFLNGKKIANHPSGYTPFTLFLDNKMLNFVDEDYGTGALFGDVSSENENVLTIFIDPTKPDGWWYDGGGIYRNVFFHAANQLSIKPFGVYVPSQVTSEIKYKDGELKKIPYADAMVSFYTIIADDVSRKQTYFYIRSTVKDSKNRVVGEVLSKSLIDPMTETEVKQSLNIKNIDLWSIENPSLFTVETELIGFRSLEIIDHCITNFGVRDIKFDKENGFLLNKVPTKIQGMANHQDFAGIGVAVPDSMQSYRIQKMQEMGANAWRTAHNPPTIALLDAADRLGMLVWDENHRNLVTDEMQNDLKTHIMRDRNHPSVIMWSICNEILCEDFDAKSAKVLKKIIRKYDPLSQRPVTSAMNGGYMNYLFVDQMDVFGINYHHNKYEDLHALHPNHPMIGSETSSDYSDRGIYHSDTKDKKYVSAYDVNYPSWGATAEDAWCSVSDQPFMAGAFIWTGFDYRGEPTPFGWPNVVSHFGNIDLCGFEKDNFYYYQSVWRNITEDKNQAMVHLLPHWNWAQSSCSGFCQVVNDSMQISVWAYTTGDSVELFLNDQSLGVQTFKTANCNRHLEWKVPYTPGKLSAKAFLNGQPHAETEIVTTVQPKQIRLVQDFPSKYMKTVSNYREQVVLIKAEVIDKNKNIVPDANYNLEFSIVEGSEYARIIGLGNGDPSSHENEKPVSSTLGSRYTFNGLARVVLQSTPEVDINKLKPYSFNVKLQVSGEGLETSVIDLKF